MSKIRERDQEVADVIIRRYLQAKKGAKRVALKTIVDAAESDFHIESGIIKVSRILKRC